MNLDSLNKYLNSPKALLSPDPSKPMNRQGNTPSFWGKDSLTELLEKAQQSTYATYINYGLIYRRFTDIYDTLLRISRTLTINDNNVMQVFFLHRTCSAFVAAVRLSSSGQVPETYPELRSALEYSLYAFHISKNVPAAFTWLARHDDKKSKSTCQQEFRIGPIMTELEHQNSDVGQRTRKLYEDCIDYGAHPNERAVLQSIKSTASSFQIIFLESGESDAMKLALIQTARIGVSCLDIFQYVFLDAYSDSEIQKILPKLQQNL